MTTIFAKDRRNYLTRKDLAVLLSVTPQGINSAIERGALTVPPRVEFPSGKSIEAWPVGYCEAFRELCELRYRMPTFETHIDFQDYIAHGDRLSGRS